MKKNILQVIWQKIRKTKAGQFLVKNSKSLRLMEIAYSKIFPQTQILYKADGYSILLDPKDSGIARRYLIDGEHEGFSKRWVAANIAPDVFYDVGANIGDWSLFISSSYPACEVLAFEPHPRLFKMMEFSIQANQFCNIKPHNFGLGSVEQITTLHCDLKNQGNNSVLISEDSIEFEKITIHIKRAVDYISYRKNTTTVIKLDVQGFEFDILKNLTDDSLLSECIFMLEIDCNTSINLYNWIEQHLINANKLVRAIDERSEEIIVVRSIDQLVKLATKIVYFDIIISPI